LLKQELTEIPRYYHEIRIIPDSFRTTVARMPQFDWGQPAARTGAKSR
jgi:hypothetical protein